MGGVGAQVCVQCGLVEVLGFLMGAWWGWGGVGGGEGNAGSACRTIAGGIWHIEGLQVSAVQQEE